MTCISFECEIGVISNSLFLLHFCFVFGRGVVSEGLPRTQGPRLLGWPGLGCLGVCVGVLIPWVIKEKKAKRVVF